LIVASSKSEEVHELANLLREPALLEAVMLVVVVVVVILAAVTVFADGIESLNRRRKPRLGGGLNPNPARMNPARGGGVAEQDGVVAVGDLAAVAVAATAVGGAERQRQRTAGLEVAVDRTEAEERQRNGIDGADGKRNGFRFGMMGSRFGVRFGFGEGVRNIAGACEGEEEEEGEENGNGRRDSSGHGFGACLDVNVKMRK